MDLEHKVSITGGEQGGAEEYIQWWRKKTGKELEIMIQIREEAKRIHTTHFLQANGISRETFDKALLTMSDHQASPECFLDRYCIDHLLEKFQIEPETLISADILGMVDEWEHVELASVEDGLFLSSSKNQMVSYIQDMGLWNAQGMVNHEHLKSYIENPVLQTILAKRLLKILVRKILHIGVKQSVIYWNGAVDSTLCVYAMPANGEVDLKKFDNYLKIRDCLVWEWNDSLRKTQ